MSEKCSEALNSLGNRIGNLLKLLRQLYTRNEESIIQKYEQELAETLKETANNTQLVNEVKEIEEGSTNDIEKLKKHNEAKILIQGADELRTTYEAKLSLQSIKIDKFKKTIDELQVKSNEQEVKIKKLNEEVNLKVGEVIEVMQLFEAEQKKNYELKRAHSELEANIKTVHKQLYELHKTNKELEDDIQRVKEQCEQQVSKLNKEIVAKSSQLSKQNKELGELSLQYKGLKSYKENIQGEMKKKDEEIEGLRNDNAELIMKYKELDTSLLKISIARNKEKELLETKTKEYDMVTLPLI